MREREKKEGEERERERERDRDREFMNGSWLEKAHWLRALVAFPEHLGFIASIHRQALTVYNCSSGGLGGGYLTSSSGLHRYQTCM